MTNAAIIGKRTSFDNATIFLHEDGTLSTRSYFVRGGKLPLATMWRLFDDVGVYTVNELPDFIRAARAGRIPARPRPSAEESEAIMASNARRRVDAAWEKVINRRAVTWR